jgi:predicted deacylase
MEKEMGEIDLLKMEPGTRKVGWFPIGLGEGVRIPFSGVRGRKPGLRVLVIGAQHGDECFGILGASQVIKRLDPEKLSGEVWAIPCINPPAYSTGSRRSIFDQQDMNRVHPGNPKGSHTEQIAHFLHTHLLPEVDLTIDLHGGSSDLGDISFGRWVDGKKSDEYACAMRELCEALGLEYLVEQDGKDGPGLLSGNADKFKMGLIAIEAGSSRTPSRANGTEMANFVLRGLSHLEMIPSDGIPRSDRKAQYVRIVSQRAYTAGLFTSAVDLGDSVEVGDEIGSIVDFFGNELVQFQADQPGVILVLRTGVRTFPGMFLHGIGVLTDQ